MSVLTDKLKDIYKQLSSLLPQFKNINAKNLNSLPKQIEEMIIGENKMSLWVNKSITSVTEDDLAGVTSIGDDAFLECTSLTSVIIPNGVTSIGSFAFWGCASLASVTIPDGVTSIGMDAFGECTSLTDIYLKPTTPPIIDSTSLVPTTTTIHIPIGSGDAYKSATNWSYYYHTSRIVEDIQPS